MYRSKVDHDPSSQPFVIKVPISFTIRSMFTAVNGHNTNLKSEYLHSSLALAVFFLLTKEKPYWIHDLMCLDVHEAQQCLSHAGVPRLVPPLPW